MSNTIAIISITIYIAGITIALIAIIAKPFKQKYTIGTTTITSFRIWSTTIICNKKIVGIAYGKSKNTSIKNAQEAIDDMYTRQPQPVKFKLD